ncbi:MAG: OmpA family protein [Myxococcota bacterium]
MSARRTAIAAVLACGLLMPAAAWAQSDGAKLGLGLRSVVKGGEKPAITVRPRAAVESVEITLTRQEDGKVQDLRTGRLRPGQSKVLAFSQPEGRFTYEAAFEVTWDDGEESRFSTTFEATRVGEPKLRIDAGDVDLEDRSIVFRLNNPVAEAELVILGERGRRLDRVVKRYDDADPGAPLEITWDPVDGEVLRLDLKVTDVAGYWTGMRITPFSIEVPHEDVEFETGRHAIRASEEPKLERTLEHIRQALAEHGTLLELKLYVAGYTDTVGSRASNQALSERRARSIARWFRAHGLEAAIYYQGFGEDVPAKPTPDETPEAANRRALYILSSQTPTGKAVPEDDWKRLR